MDIVTQNIVVAVAIGVAVGSVTGATAAVYALHFWLVEKRAGAPSRGQT